MQSSVINKQFTFLDMAKNLGQFVKRLKVVSNFSRDFYLCTGNMMYGKEGEVIPCKAVINEFIKMK